MKINCISNFNSQVQNRQNNTKTVQHHIIVNSKTSVQDTFLKNKVELSKGVNFKGKDVFEYAMSHIEPTVFGYAREKVKLTQVLLEPLLESILDPHVSVPSSVLLHGCEDNVMGKIVGGIHEIFRPLQYDAVKTLKASKQDFIPNIKSILDNHRAINQSVPKKFIIHIEEPELSLGMSSNQAKRLLNFELSKEDLQILEQNNNNMDDISYFKSLLDNCGEHVSNGGCATTFLFTSKRPHLIHPDFRKGKMEKIEIGRPRDDEAGKMFLDMLKHIIGVLYSNRHRNPSQTAYINKLANLHVDSISSQQQEEIKNFFYVNYPDGAFSYDDIFKLPFDVCDVIMANDSRVPGIQCVYAVLNNAKRSYSPEDVVRQMEIADLFEKRVTMYDKLKGRYENGDSNFVDEMFYNYYASVREAQKNTLELMEKQGTLNPYEKYTLKKFREAEM